MYTRSSQISVVYTSRQAYLQLSRDAIRDDGGCQFYAGMGSVTGPVTQGRALYDYGGSLQMCVT